MITVTPFIPLDKAGSELDDMCMSMMKKDAALNAAIPKPLRQPMLHLLRTVNSFYSSKIEGNSAHPADILRSQEMPEIEETEDLKEIKRLMEIEARLPDLDADDITICSPEMIKSLHRDFYDGAPEEVLNIEDKQTGETIKLIPGEFRTRNVQVGKHLAPVAEDVPGIMNHFHAFYRLDRISTSNAMLAAAGAHHRFVYFHPFLDGNGRVGRLFTDAYLRQAGLGGIGLWSMSRGFGRDVEAYYKALSQADMKRQGDSDGRGALSDKGLKAFTEYFIATANDQLDYFSGLLEPQALNQRIDSYFDLRCKTEMITPEGAKLQKLHPATRILYKELLNGGELTRSEAKERLGIEDRTMSTVVKQMKEAGLVTAPPRKPLQMDLSPSAIEIMFPRLWNV